MNTVLLRLLLLLVLLFGAVPVFAETITVPAGGDLQAALDRAAPGDKVSLQAGARFVGLFRLPLKPAGPVIVVTSSATLPERRVGPDDALLMPTIVSSAAQMAIDATGASNWVLDGLRFEPNPGGYGEVISLSRSNNITLDRILLVVPEGQQQKRGILGNGRNITLSRSFISGIWREGQDSQAFCAWDGAGPYRIVNNLLNAASENLMFGGADSSSPEDVPSDILVENNLLTKTMAWKNDSVYQVIKNILELKSAQRVIIRNNVFDGNWSGEGQAGSAIVFTPRNQDGSAPWSVVRNVLFEGNTVKNTPAIFNITGYDDAAPSLQTTDIVIRRNFLYGDGTGRMALLGNEIGSLTFDGNIYSQEAAQTSTIYFYTEGSIATITGPRAPAFSVRDLVMTDNKMQFNAYGIQSADGFGTATLESKVQNPVTWSGNVFGGGQGWEAAYPAGTVFLSLADFAIATAITPEPPPVVTPPPPSSDLSDPDLQALKAELAATKALTEALSDKLAAVIQYIASTPDTGKVQFLIKYLRMIPR